VNAYNAPPDPLAVLGEVMGPREIGKGREGTEKEEEREKKRKGVEERKGRRKEWRWGKRMGS